MLNLLTSVTGMLSPVTSSLGLEITDSAIKLTELRLSRTRKPLIAAYHVEKLPERAVDDGRIVDASAVVRALQTLSARLNKRPQYVHMVLPSQLIMVRFLKFPDIPPKDLAKLVDFELKHHIHLPFDKPIYDFVKLNGEPEQEGIRAKLRVMRSRPLKNKLPEVAEEDVFAQVAAGKESGAAEPRGVDALFKEEQLQPEEEKLQCDVMLVAAPSELVDSYMSVAQQAGLKVSSLEIKAFSLYRVIEETQFTDKLGTLLVLDVNERMADVSIFYNGMLKITRTIPVSFVQKNTQATTEIDQLFSTFSNPDAEFRNSCNDLGHELERLMNFYKYTLNNRSQEFTRLVLAGDVSRLNDIAHMLQERLQLQIERFYSDQLQVKNMFFPELFPTYAVPIGLALRGKSL
ncbi:type IV pilus biogenesis protein PilM [Paenibacillus sp. YYML68]|uniref:type IV pilus biogenesis protein PilM n=1 Tax=Paenibacillus sp. YYML68 TaxID=2909250 RepID=UPI00248F5971|nr:pilus assembly protein PilM [Paenibacillus sp. YYML68]